MKNFRDLAPYIVGYEINPGTFPEDIIKNYNVEMKNLTNVDTCCIHCGTKNTAKSFHGSLFSRDETCLDYISGRFSYFCQKCGKVNNQYDKILFEVQCKCCEKYTVDHINGDSLCDNNFYSDKIVQSSNGLHEHIQYSFSHCVGDNAYPKVDGRWLKRYRQVNPQQS